MTTPNEYPYVDTSHALAWCKPDSEDRKLVEQLCREIDRLRGFTPDGEPRSEDPFPSPKKLRSIASELDILSEICSRIENLPEGILDHLTGRAMQNDLLRFARELEEQDESD